MKIFTAAGEVSKWLGGLVLSLFKGGTLVGSRPGLNVIPGSGITLTTADDAANDRVNLTIAATGAGTSPLTTKGDVWGYSSADARIPIGSNGQVLTADSSQTLGLRWAAVTGTGTVTSIDVSGGTTGLTSSGGPVTTSGTVTLAGVLVEANGGTHQSSYLAGDTLYASSLNTLAKLPGNTSTSRQFLSQTGTGSVSAAPAWGILGAGDVPSVDTSKLTSGTLPEVRGGTNQSAYTLGDTLYTSAANTLSRLAGNTTTAKQFLSQTGTGSASAAPAWGILAAADYPTFLASGGGHARGAVPDPGGSAGSTHFLREDATWAVPASGSPGGSNQQVQFNDSSAFGGDADLTWNKAVRTLTIYGNGNTTVQVQDQSTSPTFQATLCSTVGAGYFQDATRQVKVCDGTNHITYSAATSSDWGTAPTDVWAALDTLATRSTYLTPLFNYFADQGCNNVGETDLYSDTVVAGTLKNSGDRLMVEYAGALNAASCTVRAYFAGTKVYDSGNITPGSGGWELRVTVMYESNTVVRVTAFLLAGTTAPPTNYTRVTGLDLSSTGYVMKVTGIGSSGLPSTNDIVAKLGSIDKVRHA